MCNVLLPQPKEEPTADPAKAPAPHARQPQPGTLKEETKGSQVDASASAVGSGLLTNSAPAIASAPRAPGRRRLLDSDDDSPVRPRGIKKSKLLSDSSEDDVVLDSMRIAPRSQPAAVAGVGQKQQKPKPLQNGTALSATPVRRKAPGTGQFISIWSVEAFFVEGRMLKVWGLKAAVCLT